MLTAVLFIQTCTVTTTTWINRQEWPQSDFARIFIRAYFYFPAQDFARARARACLLIQQPNMETWNVHYVI